MVGLSARTTPLMQDEASSWGIVLIFEWWEKGLVSPNVNQKYFKAKSYFTKICALSTFPKTKWFFFLISNRHNFVTPCLYTSPLCLKESFKTWMVFKSYVTLQAEVMRPAVKESLNWPFWLVQFHPDLSSKVSPKQRKWSFSKNM